VSKMVHRPQQNQYVLCVPFRHDIACQEFSLLRRKKPFPVASELEILTMTSYRLVVHREKPYAILRTGLSDQIWRLMKNV